MTKHVLATVLSLAVLIASTIAVPVQPGKSAATQRIGASVELAAIR